MLFPTFEKPTSSRSANMRAIRSTGNRSTEWRLRSILIREGIRGWKLQDRLILGKPDIVFPSQRLILFIDGCYWHGCPKCGHIPKTNREYWTAKIGRNKLRDRRYSRELKRQGYRVIRIWECVLKKDPSRVLSKISAAIEAAKPEID